MAGDVVVQRGHGGTSLDQQRAAHAFRCAQEHRAGGEEYVNLVKGSAALVMTNGLIASLAYLQHKSAHGQAVVKDVLSWLHIRKLCASARFDEAMRVLVEEPSARFMQITDETLEFLRWLKQLSSALGSDK